MGTIVDAITWSGSGATLSLFAVYPQTPPHVDPGALGLPEFHAQTYLLDDEAGLLGGGSLVEYDFHFASVPADLRKCLRTLLDWARASGAIVTWFGFEGSFHFEHLLTEDVANQVYALADNEGIALAEDQDLESVTWRERVVRAGGRVTTGQAA